MPRAPAAQVQSMPLFLNSPLRPAHGSRPPITWVCVTCPRPRAPGAGLRGAGRHRAPACPAPACGRLPALGASEFPSRGCRREGPDEGSRAWCTPRRPPAGLTPRAASRLPGDFVPGSLRGARGGRNLAPFSRKGRVSIEMQLTSERREET